MFCNFFEIANYNHVTNFQGRLLDLVLFNRVCEVRVVDDPLIPQDKYHPALSVDHTICKVKFKAYPPKVNCEFNFKKAHFHALYAEMSAVDWSFLNECGNDVNLMVESFTEKILSLFRAHVPSKRPASAVYPPWFNGDVINKIKRKERLRCKYKKTGRLQFYE